MAQMLGEFANRMANKEEREDFVDYLTRREHRTLQQSAMGLFVAAIEAWASTDNFDLRNEATVNLAKRIVENTGDKYDRMLPFI